MLTLYPARSIITMNDSMPRASAVLVRDGLIIEVGERENMQPWLDRGEYQVDEQFSDKVICPGFIDPHLHPSMAAVLLPMEFVTAMRWKLPWGTVEPTTSPEPLMHACKLSMLAKTMLMSHSQTHYLFGAFISYGTAR